MNSIASCFMAVLMVLNLLGCNATNNPANPDKNASVPPQEVRKSTPPAEISENKEIRDLKPVKPPKIKLHRNAKGEYAWDITGDSPDDISRIDKRLRQLLKTE
ncbi:MAG TPA: hypothetical protein VK448_10530 [Dissulfurispiraceae bacterium]|nr:hypothetical protein [Dissulfurispiraceae bacterium]